jgi:hypothetical protein
MMYVVESADDLAILSSIENSWRLGKTCWVVGTYHIIVDCTSSQYCHVCCGQGRHLINSCHHRQHMRFGPELLAITQMNIVHRLDHDTIASSIQNACVLGTIVSSSHLVIASIFNMLFIYILILKLFKRWEGLVPYWRHVEG